MIAKASISFLNDATDSQLISDTSGIVQALTANAIYPTPTPTLAAVSTALAAFTHALAAAAEGGIPLTLAKNDARAALAGLLRELASYVQLACKGDLTKLLTSGFPVQKAVRTPVGILPPPAVTVKLGSKSGDLAAKLAPMAGAAIYNWRVTTASSPAAPVFTAQTTAASHTFAGLTPGVVYQVTANAVSSAGTSDWSDPATQMVV